MKEETKAKPGVGKCAARKWKRMLWHFGKEFPYGFGVTIRAYSQAKANVENQKLNIAMLKKH